MQARSLKRLPQTPPGRGHRRSGLSNRFVPFRLRSTCAKPHEDSAEGGHDLVSLRPHVPIGRADHKQTNKVGMMGRDTCPVQRNQTISRTPGTAEYANTSVQQTSPLLPSRSARGAAWQRRAGNAEFGCVRDCISIVPEKRLNLSVIQSIFCGDPLHVNN